MPETQPQIIEQNGKRFILDAAGRLTPIIFEPFPTQQAFLNSTADVTLFGGSRGPGKSAAILPEAMQFGNIPGYKALIMRRTFPRLKELLDRATLLLPQYGWKKSEYDFKHPDGGIIRFGHCEYEDNVLNYQGHEYQRIYIDQVEEFTKGMFDFLSTCCRSTIPTIPARIKLTANPGGVGHYWVKTLFIDNCPPVPNGPRIYNEEFDCWWQPELPGPLYKDEVGLTYSYIPAKVFENPFLLQNDKAYVLRLKKLPEDLRKAHLDGRWDVHIGQFFKEFDPEVHVIKDTWPIPKHWLRYVSLDYGAKRPFVALFHTVNPKSGELFTYKEYWARDKTLQYHGAALAHLFAKENSIETIFYPHDMHRNERRDEAGFDSIVETLIDYIEQELGNLGRGRMDLSFEKGVMGPNTRVMKWSKMRDALAKPWWYIFKNCEQLVRTLPMMSYGKPEKDGASSDDIAASDVDHWVEAASHAIVHVPRETEQRQKRDDYGFRSGPYSGGEKGLLPQKHWLEW